MGFKPLKFRKIVYFHNNDGCLDLLYTSKQSSLNKVVVGLYFYAHGHYLYAYNLDGFLHSLGPIWENPLIDDNGSYADTHNYT
jgi:hypothetical protein